MSAPSPVSAEHYEALRQHAVTAVFPADPLGAMLVVQAGVAGWMEQWGQIAAAVRPPSSPPPLPRPPREPGWQQELTMLLAEMTTRAWRASSLS